MDMCFVEANRAWNTFYGTPKITRDQYLESSLAHLRGIRHPEDISPPRFRHVGPWVGAFMEVALEDNYEPLSDTSEWKKLLESCMDGDYASFQASISKFDLSCNPSPLQPAACIAASDSHHDILRHCLKLGAKMTPTLKLLCRRSVRTFEMMEVLYEADWEEIRTSTKAAESEIAYYGQDSLQAAWLKKYALPGGLSNSLDNHKSPDVRAKIIADTSRWVDHLW